MYNYSNFFANGISLQLNMQNRVVQIQMNASVFIQKSNIKNIYVHIKNDVNLNILIFVYKPNKLMPIFTETLFFYSRKSNIFFGDLLLFVFTMGSKDKKEFLVLREFEILYYTKFSKVFLLHLEKFVNMCTFIYLFLVYVRKCIISVRNYSIKCRLQFVFGNFIQYSVHGLYILTHNNCLSVLKII